MTNQGITQAAAAEGELQALLDRVEPAMAATGDDAFVTFIAALTILVREGLEALLVVVAMIAFLRKAGRFETLRFVHAGWVLALAAGGATWGVATWLVSISGASREMTEGFSSLFAAVVLLGVGIWMHQKSVAGRWQLYLKQKLSAALNKRTAWLMFGLAFISVYREVFETVLFYAALWTEGNGLPLLAGLGTGIVVLGIDLKKDPKTLHAAYNDAPGVTAAFNRNLLVRMNRELGADFDVESFAHYAFYEPVNGRIEMHLVSLTRQTVTVAGREFRFTEGESIRTECSYKYDLPGAERFARTAGLHLLDAWLDDDRRFAVLDLRPVLRPVLRPAPRATIK